MKRLALLTAVLAAIGPAAYPAGGTLDMPALAAEGRLRAVLVGGLNHDPEEVQQKARAVAGCWSLLTEKWGVSPKHLRVLVAEEAMLFFPAMGAAGPRASTRENIAQAIAQMGADLPVGGVFLLFFTGQANAVLAETDMGDAEQTEPPEGQGLRFNLPGADITHEDLAQWIDAAAGEAQRIVVLDCPRAGMALEAIKGPGLIAVCASREDQPYATRFSAKFLPASTNPEADIDEDGTITLLEAFQLTAQDIDDFYRERRLFRTETPLLEDDGDGIPAQNPWRFRELLLDGEAASRMILMHVADEQPRRVDTPTTEDLPHAQR